MKTVYKIPKVKIIWKKKMFLFLDLIAHFFWLRKYKSKTILDYKARRRYVGWYNNG